MVTRWLVFLRWWIFLLLVGLVEQALLIPGWWWVIAWWWAPSSVRQRWQWWVSVGMLLWLVFHWHVWQVMVVFILGGMGYQSLKLTGAKDVLRLLVHTLLLLSLSWWLQHPRFEVMLLLAQIGWSFELGILGGIWQWWRSRTRE